MEAKFLPELPLTLSYPLLFGVLVLAGMLGGELARRLHLPRVLGYVLAGLLVAPVAESSVGPLIEKARIFVDLAIGLVLFDLGRRMDLGWMKRDWTLAASGLAESLLTFGLVFATLVTLGFQPVQAGLAGAIAIATSPAVLLAAVRDERAEGQVTERAMNLVALNSLFASILVTILLASVHYQARVDLETAFLHPLYLFAGSVALGGAATVVARLLARVVEKSPEMHFIVIAGLIIAAVGAAQVLKLSVILSLLAFGLFAGNDERRRALLTVELGRASRLFYIVLFVITGASLPVGSLQAAGWAVLAFVAARAVGKMAGVLAFSTLGGLRARQSLALGAALLPMSSLALLLQHDVAKLYPVFAENLTAVLLGGILVMEVLGPLALQFGLRVAGEAHPDYAAGGRTGAYVPLKPEA